MAQREAETPPADSWAAVFAQIRKENEDLRTELAEVKSKRNKADKEYAQKHPEPTKEVEKEEKKEEAPSRPHFYAKWQKFCPECGEENPEFKDETLCDTPGCNFHMGAIDNLPNVKKCPQCGGHSAHKIKVKEVEQEAKQ